MYRNLELLNTFLTSESDDDLELLLIATQNEEGERRNRRRCGSIPGRRVINRDRAGGHRRLYQDYFSNNPTYSDDQFRRRFRMRRPLFCRILNAVESYDPYFVQRNDAIGVPDLSSLQKVIAALRILAYGIPADLLDRSHVFLALTNGCAPPVNFIVNGNNYSMVYYLADGIYPSWATFVKTIFAPHSFKAKHFAKLQEGARKDVERAFGVLQARFSIVCGPTRFWDENTLSNIMKACIIMHNMIVEDEKEGASNVNFDHATPDVIPSHEHTNEFVEFIQSHHQIRDRGTHSQIQRDLVEHLWNSHGQED